MSGCLKHLKTLFKDARIIDGTGAPEYYGDVLLSEGVIVAVEQNIAATSAGEIINAAGLTLAPGFIDVHSHSDLSILAAPEAFGKISQGVTTEIIGNCGLSPFPLTDLNRGHLQELWGHYQIDLTWNSCSGYLREVERRQPAVNIFPLVGHNTLRAAVIGYDTPRPATTSELAAMQQLLAASIADGAIGLSFGLPYVPGKFADQNELAMLRMALPGRDHPCSFHLRSEGNSLENALAEAFNSAKQSNQHKVHISHLKTSGEANWHKLDRVFGLIKQAQQCDGLCVTADRYPYVESMTQLSMILPEPYCDLDDSSLDRQLRDNHHFEAVVAALAQLLPGRWENIRLVSGAPHRQTLFGKTFDHIAAITGQPPHLTCAEILRESTLSARAAFHGMSEANMKQIIQAPFTVCGSDESALPAHYSFGRGHPRGFGSFPRFIRGLSESGMSLEQIIYKLTGQSAAIFNLPRRGTIKPGNWADLVLFEPDIFLDQADFKSPHQPAVGINQVWVNGKHLYSL